MPSDPPASPLASDPAPAPGTATPDVAAAHGGGGSGPPDAWFRRAVFWGTLASLTPLIPVPFLDDKVLAWVRRKQVRETLERSGLQPEPGAVRVLAGDEDPRSALAGCLRLTLVLPLLKISYYILRKLFRKIVFFLLIKDSVDQFSESFQENLLLHRAIELGALGSPERIRQAMLETRRTVNPRPVERVVRKIYRGSRRLLGQGARLLTSFFRAGRAADEVDGLGAGSSEGAMPAREAVIDAEERLLSGLLDRITTALWNEAGYRERLHATFDALLTQEPPSTGGGEPV